MSGGGDDLPHWLSNECYQQDMAALIEITECQNAETELNPFWDAQPVKVAEKRVICLECLAENTSRAAALRMDCSLSSR